MYAFDNFLTSILYPYACLPLLYLSWQSLSEYATNPSLQQCSLAQSLSSSLQGHHNHHQQYPSSQLESVTRIALSSTEATPVPVLSITQPTSTSPPSSSQHPVGFYYGPFGSSVYPKYDGPNPFPYGFPPPGYSFSPYSRSIKENLPGQTSTNTNIVDCSGKWNPWRLSSVEDNFFITLFADESDLLAKSISVIGAPIFFDGISVKIGDQMMGVCRSE